MAAGEPIGDLGPRNGRKDGYSVECCQLSLTALCWPASCMLYAAQFSKEGSGKYIAAGGSGANEAKVFDHSNNNTVVGTITGLSRGVFAVDFGPENDKVAVAGGDSSIRIFSIHESDE